MASRKRYHKPWGGLLGALERRSSAIKQVCAVWGPCCPRQGAPLLAPVQATVRDHLLCPQGRAYSDAALPGPAGRPAAVGAAADEAAGTLLRCRSAATRKAAAAAVLGAAKAHL